MGFFNSKKAKERKAFRSIVEKKSTQAARQAFSDEAIKVAGEKAREKARRKSIGEIIAERVRGSVESKASGRRISTPKASPKRKVTKRKASPKRKVVRRRRAVKKVTITPITSTPSSPTNLNEAIFG